MAETGRRQALTRDEVARVLHRAAEIEAAGDGVTADRYDAQAVEQAAREVGLSPSAVRQAVAELHAGALPAEADAGSVAERGPGSRFVIRQGLVASEPEAVHEAVDRFARSQMFELRRRSGDRAVYRLRKDLVATLRRQWLAFGGAIKLEDLRTVTVVATPAGDRTLVRLEAELTTSRANVVAGSAGAGGGVAMLMGLGGALAAEPALLIAAPPVGAAVGVGGVRVFGSRWRRRRDDVDEVLADLLDRL